MTGLEPTQGEPLCADHFLYPSCVERCFCDMRYSTHKKHSPRCKLGEEQRPWGVGSPDMGGTPPTSSSLPWLSPWTKPSKESSVTEARTQQRLFLKCRFWRTCALRSGASSSRFLHAKKMMPKKVMWLIWRASWSTGRLVCPMALYLEKIQKKDLAQRATIISSVSSSWTWAVKEIDRPHQAVAMLADLCVSPTFSAPEIAES